MIPLPYISPELEKWFETYHRNFQHRKPWRIVATWFDDRFVLVHQPGEYWGDNSGSHYGKVCHTLVDREAHSFFEGTTGSGVKDFEGRFGRTMFHEASISCHASRSEEIK